MDFTRKALITEAKQVKNFMETNHKIPLSCTLSTGEIISPYSVAYLFASMIKEQLRKPKYSLINVRIYDPSTKIKDTINGEKVMKNDYLTMNTNFLKFTSKYHRVPRFITTQKTQTKVSFELYLYSLTKIIIYLDKNNTYPNYCIFDKAVFADNKNNPTTTKKEEAKPIATQTKTTKTTCTNPYTSKPHYLESGCNKLGQCTSYYCGPHSIHQALKKFGITKYSEKQIAAMTGTTTKGSDHPGINTAIAKISKATKIPLKVKWMNFSSLGKDANARFLALAKLLCKSNTAVICHIGYQGKGESATGTIFGHYECLDKVNTKTKYVRALNSLGTQKSNGSYPGHVQDRPYALQAKFFANTPGGQPAICIITKG